jgi:Ser/Thr protein kinase RdoA (MazF antagonist)
MSDRAAAAGLVHGMGKELAEPDWSPLTGPEVSAVLAGYGPPGGASSGAAAVITWRSPRPMSAAALVRRDGTPFFVKRHDTSVRTAAQLAGEHAFASHLRAHGLPVPAVLRRACGATTVERGGFVYEVHSAARGVDLYRDAMSWSPFSSLSHARTAGATLARLHRAAADFPVAARAPGVLTSSCDVITAADPVAAVSLLLATRPGLARYLCNRHWQQDMARHHLPAIRRAAPLLEALPRQWGHGDWHPSNLTWTSAAADAGVAAVLDFGLANRTFAVHDLATALERSTVGWLDLPGSGRADADHDAIDALLDGYETVRPLHPAEAAALPEVLPVVHLEYALSEIEYFADVVRSRGNADLAYDTYLVDHARWFEGPEGSAVLEHLRQRAVRAQGR